MNLFLSSDSRPVHFVGIAGAGMSALAMLALRRGVSVTGTDRAPEGASDLVNQGAKVLQGHHPEVVDGARAVVVSAAIPPDDPDVLRALAAGIPVIARKAALGELVANGRVVAVAGTHGKTTTTVMVTEALAAAGLDPTGLAGGRVASWGGNARVAGDDLFVVEADEYDQAFLALHPAIAVINNIEPEHLECYHGSVDEMEEAFATFAGRAELALIGTVDEASNRVAKSVGGAVWRFGFGGGDLPVSDVRAAPEGSRATVGLPDGRRVTLRVGVPGAHNVLNATAALGVVAALGADVPAALEALAAFRGVGRRFERKGSVAGVELVDDYAHHATELVATLEAARQAFPDRRLVAVFQPHLYSRTLAQADAMGRALSLADVAFVTEIYPARETPIPGVTGAMVVDAARRHGAAAQFAPDRDRLGETVGNEVREGDVVLTLGAGDITSFGPELLARLAPG